MKYPESCHCGQLAFELNESFKNDYLAISKIYSTGSGNC